MSNVVPDGLKTGDESSPMDTSETSGNVDKFSTDMELSIIRIFEFDSMRDDLKYAYSDAIIAIGELNLNASEREIQSNINEILIQVIYAFKQSKAVERLSNEQSTGSQLGYNELDEADNSKEGSALGFLLMSLTRCQREMKTVSHRVLPIIEKCIFANMASLMRGHFAPFLNGRNAQISFLKRLYDDILPDQTLHGFIAFMVNNEDMDEVAISEVFNPILDMQRYSIGLQKIENLPSQQYTFLIYRSLLRLVSIKIGATRPFCDLISRRSDFNFVPFTKNQEGVQTALMSFFGPFFNFGLPTEYERCPNNVFVGASENGSDDAIKIEMKQYQMHLSTIRSFLHQMMHQFLVNSSTRAPTLKWISDLLKTNWRKTQIHNEYIKTAPNHYMFNLLMVLYDLSSKIGLDKVNPYYPFQSNSLVDITEKTRIKMNSNEAKEYSDQIQLKGEEKFTTECFFLTIACQNLTYEPVMKTFKENSRIISDLRRKLDSVKNKSMRSGGVPSPEDSVLMEKLNIQLKRMSRLSKCLECFIRDPAFITMSHEFSNKQLQLLRTAAGYAIESGEGSNDVLEKNMFKACPEHYVEDLYNIYSIHLSSSDILNERIDDWPSNFLYMFINYRVFQNPFLVSKILELLARLVPSHYNHALWMNVINNQLARDHFLPALIKFYSDFEDNGEFYEKFNVRHNIQTIFNHLKDDYYYKSVFIELAQNCGPEFIRFINMIINDATWCIDESIDALKTIHDVEKSMERTDEWNAMNRETREQKEGAYEEASRKVKSWLAYAMETLNVMLVIINLSQQPFMQPILGERLAAMLNHNLAQLLGKKCQELKVKEPIKRYGFDPRRFVSVLIDIYLSLHSQNFSKYIAHDERTYSPEMMKEIVNRLHQRSIVSVSNCERFVRLAEDVEKEYQLKAAMDEELEDAPEEFKDPIMDAIMSDPVKLPSGHIMERSVIERHLLSTPNNPFNRAPLTIEEVVPDTELKERISKWIEEKRAEMRNKGV